MVPSFSIIIVNYNGEKLISDCIRSLYLQTYKNFEIIVVDNASKDHSVDIIKKNFPEIKIIQTGFNSGYAEGNNIGYRYANGDYLIFLNFDAFPASNWLESIAYVISQNPSMHILGCKIFRYGTRFLDSAGAYIEYPLGCAPGRGSGEPDSPLYNKIEKMAYVSGASLVIKKETFKQIGGFDPVYFCYHEETDLCWRARLLGYDVYFVPSAIVHHMVSSTLGECNPYKQYLITRNRIITNIKNLEITNVLYSILYEIFFATFTVFSSLILNNTFQLIGYLRAVFFVMRNLKCILNKRTAIQSRRQLPDNVVLLLHTKVKLGHYLKK